VVCVGRLWILVGRLVWFLLARLDRIPARGVPTRMTNMEEMMTQERAVCIMDGCTDLVHCIRTYTNEQGEERISWRKKCWFHHSLTFEGVYIKKDYCENRDGRLGFVCDATIRYHGQLEEDHIDGNPTNDDPANKQTLCGLCHPYKTWKNKDGQTLGRKRLAALGQYYEEMKALQLMARGMGLPVTLYINEQGIFDQVYIHGYGLRDPLSAAEILRWVTRSYSEEFAVSDGPIVHF